MTAPTIEQEALAGVHAVQSHHLRAATRGFESAAADGRPTRSSGCAGQSMPARRPATCQRPSLIGDPAFEVSWATFEGCDAPAVWLYQAVVQRVLGTDGPFRERRLAPGLVETGACGQHPLHLIDSKRPPACLTVRRLSAPVERGSLR